MKKKILILNGQYAPGYKGGGPIQSCINMVENLYKSYDFKVICADRDYKETIPYSNIKIDEWNKVGHADVFYMSPKMQTLKGFEKTLNETEYDVLYLNGYFSPIFTIKPLLLRRLGRLKKNSVILTPRGDFTGGCENKKIKKYLYIFLTKLIGLYSDVIWHTTSELEKSDVKKKFKKAITFVVPNLPAKFVEKEPVISKEKGALKMVFISRIFPKKNIKYALDVLKNIKEGSVIFDIYGPMEDMEYWKECEEIIKEMPPNIHINYCGEAEHENIPSIFEQYHVFFFPTLGENYGHVIVEAMMNNCLCLLSKGVTPWDDYNICGDLVHSLSDLDSFITSVKNLIKMDNDEFCEHIYRNNRYIESKVNAQSILLRYQEMFG